MNVGEQNQNRGSAGITDVGQILTSQVSKSSPDLQPEKAPSHSCKFDGSREQAPSPKHSGFRFGGRS